MKESTQNFLRMKYDKWEAIKINEMDYQTIIIGTAKGHRLRWINHVE